MTLTAPDPLRDPQAFLLHLYRVAVQRAQPLHSMAQHLPPPPPGRTVVLGAGKAGASMAQALEGRPLSVRALDIGGDKQVAHLELPREDNPFLGVR
uniref:putative PEP-binding protein n=1 Tax=Salmonella sp. s29873 TaxID=3159634 RepID=UPI0039818D42